MPNLLIVDDDIHLRKLVRTYADLEGFTCTEAIDGGQALSLLDKTKFDLIILDIMMPGIDGLEVLENIRNTSDVPVIMLTSRTEEYDRLQGFRVGADDYVSKPFSPMELMARTRAILKRSGYNQVSSLTFKKLCIQIGARKVTIDGQNVSLPPKEFDLLLYLAQNVHLALTREKLLNAVWGYDYYGDPRTLDTHIRSLREHLGNYSTFIKTVWGGGYKFEHE